MIAQSSVYHISHRYCIHTNWTGLEDIHFILILETIDNLILVMSSRFAFLFLLKIPLMQSSQILKKKKVGSNLKGESKSLFNQYCNFFPLNKFLSMWFMIVICRVCSAQSKYRDPWTGIGGEKTEIFPVGLHTEKNTIKLGNTEE